MTNDTKDLTVGEKLDLILTKLSNMEARLAKLEARRNGAALPTPVSAPDSDLWMDHKDAAVLMRRPAAYLRRRWADGSYKYWPEIERWQPGGFRTRLYVRREHVERWIEASRTPAPSPVRTEFGGMGYESALPTMRRLGAYGTMKSFGLK